MAEIPAKLALPAPRAERMSLLLARCAALIVIAIGGIVLTAWRLGLPRLSEALPGLAGMTPNAACRGDGRRGRAVLLHLQAASAALKGDRLCAGFVRSVVLCQDLFGFDFGLDNALFPADASSVDVSATNPAPAWRPA